jgi:hypothetical protein
MRREKSRPFATGEPRTNGSGARRSIAKVLLKVLLAFRIELLGDLVEEGLLLDFFDLRVGCLNIFHSRQIIAGPPV